MQARGAVRSSALTTVMAFGLWHGFVAGLTAVAQGTHAGPSAIDGFAGRISIDVQVTDKSGRPISGLEAGNFKVFDNKHEQQILDFKQTDTAHPAAVPAQIQIIIDAMNSGPVTVAQERDGVSAFLRENAGKLEFATSIWALETAGLKQIAAPSKDGAALVAALNGTQSPLRIINRSAGLWGDVERADQAIKLIKSMIAPDARTRGRKLVLFVSPGWPLLFNYELDDRGWLFNDIVDITNSVRESDITLYALAPSNFNTLTPYGSSTRAFSYDDFLKGVTRISDAQYADVSLQVLAEHSGGLVMIEGNDIKREIETAVRDASAYYTLSFERAPSHGRTDYHAIRVAVDKAGMKVRTTAGYYIEGP